MTSGGVADRPSTITLAADLTSVKIARRFVEDACHRAGVRPGDCDTAVLLASEVVTNALLHGRSEARIRVDVDAGRVLVEVGDDNSRHPIAASLDDEALDGRGLAIIDLLASRWGVRDDAVGKTVWFEIHRA